MTANTITSTNPPAAAASSSTSNKMDATTFIQCKDSIVATIAYLRNDGNNKAPVDLKVAMSKLEPAVVSMKAFVLDAAMMKKAQELLQGESNRDAAIQVLEGMAKLVEETYLEPKEEANTASSSSPPSKRDSSSLVGAQEPSPKRHSPSKEEKDASTTATTTTFKEEKPDDGKGPSEQATMDAKDAFEENVPSDEPKVVQATKEAPMDAAKEAKDGAEPAGEDPFMSEEAPDDAKTASEEDSNEPKVVEATEKVPTDAAKEAKDAVEAAGKDPDVDDKAEMEDASVGKDVPKQDGKAPAAKDPAAEQDGKDPSPTSKATDAPEEAPFDEAKDPEATKKELAPTAAPTN